MPHSLNLNGTLLDLSAPKVMAVVNITPDSFYGASRLLSEKDLLLHIEKALADGAAIIDIGAYSTRPSAKQVPREEELQRLRLPLKAVRKHFPNILLSVDTFRAEVARCVVQEFGVQMINDIGGGTLDEQMIETIADLRVAYVLMHMRGTPETMQQFTAYDNLMHDVLHFFETQTARLVELGVKDTVLDPGFGFAKTLDQNYELLAKMNYLKELGFPILAGVSRKSMIYNLLNSAPEHALNGTSVVNTLALLNGANILRVHDVREAVETISIVQKYVSQQNTLR